MFTVLLTIGMFQGASANIVSTLTGPGTYTDYWNNKSEYWSGAPKTGYHVKTVGTEGNYTQTIEADQAADTPLISKDPANGVSGDYVPKTFHGQSIYNVPEKVNGQTPYAPGYPEAAVAKSITTVLQQHSHSVSGPSGSKTFPELFAENDYVAMVFGACSWCNNCKEFMPNFNKYYNAVHGKQGSFEAVYFSSDYTQETYDAATAGYPMLKADYSEQEQISLVQNVLGVASIPSIVIVAKDGSVVTTHGVDGIMGKQMPESERFPLPAGAEYFKDEAEPTQDCPVDEQEQEKQLKDAVRDRVNALNDLQLKYYAKRVTDSNDAQVPDDESDADVRAYVIQRFDQFIEEAKGDRAKLTELYAKLSEERNDAAKQRFEVHDRIRVLRAFKSDAYRGATGQDVPATANGKPNTGEILNVMQDAEGVYTTAIWVKFDDNEYARRWLLPNSYEFVEKIEGPQRTKSSHL